MAYAFSNLDARKRSSQENTGVLRFQSPSLVAHKRIPVGEQSEVGKVHCEAVRNKTRCYRDQSYCEYGR